MTVRLPSPASLPYAARRAAGIARRRLAHRLAADLAAIAGGPGSFVVVAHPVTGDELERATSGQAVPVGADELLRLVLPSDAAVCSVEHLHGRGLRVVAAAWRTDRLLVVPCVFGDQLLALAVAAVGPDQDRAVVEQAASRLGGRFAAGVVRACVVAAVVERRSVMPVAARAAARSCRALVAG